MTRNDLLALAEELRKTADDILDWNGKTMSAWDGWRAYIAGGGKASWPRDAFESMVQGHAELMTQAVAAITQARADGERAGQIAMRTRAANAAHDHQPSSGIGKSIAHVIRELKIEVKA